MAQSSEQFKINRVTPEAFSARLDEQQSWWEHLYMKERLNGGYDSETGVLAGCSYHTLPTPTLDDLDGCWE